MTKNFIIKEGKKSTYYCLVICLFVSVIWASQTGGGLGGLFPLVFLLSVSVLVYTIMLFRWMIFFAVSLDMDKQELILNHTLFFYKKKISFKDIKEVDILNGNIVLFSSVPLTKCQKMVCKTKKTNDYTVRFQIIDTCERRELMKLLSTKNNKNEEWNFVWTTILTTIVRIVVFNKFIRKQKDD